MCAKLDKLNQKSKTKAPLLVILGIEGKIFEKNA